MMFKLGNKMKVFQMLNAQCLNNIMDEALYSMITTNVLIFCDVVTGVVPITVFMIVMVQSR